MEWRCEWCGKPHESNDPPCDNCGHGKFESAVVRQAYSDENESSTTVWVCTDCGREHTKNSPPCSRCNNAKLEKQEKVITDENLTEGPGGTEIGSVGSETMTVWTCTECGREHPKNNPPCSRCGNAKFERETKSVSDDELTTPGYFDLVTPKYAVALGAVLLIAVAVVLGFIGVIDLPFLPENGVPEVSNVPGNESEANGVSLSTVETKYLDAVNEVHREEGAPELERSGYLDEVARYSNQRYVKWLKGDGQPTSDQRVAEFLDKKCTNTAVELEGGMPVFETASAEDLSNGLAIQMTSGGDQTLDRQGTKTGIDIHYADGELFLTQFVCET